ncbi:hypothetical protein JHK82_016396 [Glycine max]|nr:hypothetical protein JHK85_016811 [Glycine max]KAG5149515.1 hypothetical protein JHK82_016396 [Glycine max]
MKRHPDKLVKSGLSQEEVTVQFQELQHAYKVLSNPKERAWYDSHCSQILFSDPTPSPTPSSPTSSPSFPTPCSLLDIENFKYGKVPLRAPNKAYANTLIKWLVDGEQLSKVEVIACNSIAFKRIEQGVIMWEDFGLGYIHLFEGVTKQYVGPASLVYMGLLDCAVGYLKNDNHKVVLHQDRCLEVICCEGYG